MGDPTYGATLLLALHFPDADPTLIDPDALADQVADAATDSLNTGAAVEVNALPVPQWLSPGALSAVRRLLSNPYGDDGMDAAGVEHVCEALMEVGGWEEIDGDGDPASIIADHIRRLPRVLAEPILDAELDELQRSVAEELDGAYSAQSTHWSVRWLVRQRDAITDLRGRLAIARHLRERQAAEAPRWKPAPSLDDLRDPDPISDEEYEAFTAAIEAPQPKVLWRGPVGQIAASLLGKKPSARGWDPDLQVVVIEDTETPEASDDPS